MQYPGMCVTLDLIRLRFQNSGALKPLYNGFFYKTELHLNIHLSLYLYLLAKIKAHMHRHVWKTTRCHLTL